MEQPEVFVSVIEKMGITMSRFLTKANFNECKNIVETTKQYYLSNVDKYPIEVKREAKEILKYQYDEILSKIPTNSDFGIYLTEYRDFYEPPTTPKM